MGRSSLQNVQSVGDPAAGWNFDFFMPTIPGSSDTRNLTYKCMTMDLPGAGLDNIEVPLHGVLLNFAGRGTYTHQTNITFLEDSSWQTRAQFIAWRESIRSWTNNSGTPSSAYKINAQMVVYNDIPQVVNTVTLFGLWPETIGEVTMDGGQSTAVQLQITFRYDFTSPN